MPLNGLDPELNYLGTKSGQPQGVPRGRRPAAAGLRGSEGQGRRRARAGRARPRASGAARAVVKLNESFSGEGNAVFRFPESGDARVGARRDGRRSSWRSPANRTTPTSASSRGWAASSRRSSTRRTSCRRRRSCAPRRAARWWRRRRTTRSSAARPARSTRAAPSRRTRTTAVPSRMPGIADRPACWRRTAPSAASASTSWCRATTPTQPWSLHALEINLRVLGTTHPFLALQFLTGGRLDPDSGLFLSLSGRAEVLHGHRQPARHRPTAACCPRT